jgi:hypothetical protein
MMPLENLTLPTLKSTQIPPTNLKSTSLMYSAFTGMIPSPEVFFHGYNAIQKTLLARMVADLNIHETTLTSLPKKMV